MTPPLAEDHGATDLIIDDTSDPDTIKTLKTIYELINKTYTLQRGPLKLKWFQNDKDVKYVGAGASCIVFELTDERYAGLVFKVYRANQDDLFFYEAGKMAEIAHHMGSLPKKIGEFNLVSIGHFAPARYAYFENAKGDLIRMIIQQKAAVDPASKSLATITSAAGAHKDGGRKTSAVKKVLSRWQVGIFINAPDTLTREQARREQVKFELTMETTVKTNLVLKPDYIYRDKFRVITGHELIFEVSNIDQLINELARNAYDGYAFFFDPDLKAQGLRKPASSAYGMINVSVSETSDAYEIEMADNGADSHGADTAHKGESLVGAMFDETKEKPFLYFGRMGVFEKILNGDKETGAEGVLRFLWNKAGGAQRVFYEKIPGDDGIGMTVRIRVPKLAVEKAKPGVFVPTAFGVSVPPGDGGEAVSRDVSARAPELMTDLPEAHRVFRYLWRSYSFSAARGERRDELEINTERIKGFKRWLSERIKNKGLPLFVKETRLGAHVLRALVYDFRRIVFEPDGKQRDFLNAIYGGAGRGQALDVDALYAASGINKNSIRLYLRMLEGMGAIELASDLDSVKGRNKTIVKLVNEEFFVAWFGDYLKDGGLPGGVDMRALRPSGIQIGPKARSQQIVVPVDLDALHRQWESICQESAAGSVPYDKFARYVAQCSAQGAREELTAALGYIAAVLRMEEDYAVTTPPEIKAILAAFG